MQINPTKQAYQLLHNGILALARAEKQGFCIDVPYIERKQRQLTSKIQKLQDALKSDDFYIEWKKAFPFNINTNSPKQLEHILYKVKKLTPPKKTKTNKGSTDEESLKELNIPFLNKLIRIRKLKKIKDTYLASFMREQVDGVIHPSYNLHIARTYRSSSSNPNMQNVPKRDEEAMTITRKAIIPRPGHQLLELDYGSLEVKIAACYHKDKNMLKYINNPGSDLHKDMTEQIFLCKIDKHIKEHALLRSAVKNSFIFPQFYGDYYKNNALSLAKWCSLPKQGRWKKEQGVTFEGRCISNHLIEKGIKSMNGFIDHLQKIESHFWKVRFFEYGKWKETWFREYQKQGAFEMKTGFICDGYMKKNDVINYPVQGAAFHCLLWSFIEADKVMIKEKWDTRLIGQIHDSILLDVHPDELIHVAQTIKRITTQNLPKAWDWLIVPLDIDAELCPVDGSWAEKKDWEIPK